MIDPVTALGVAPTAFNAIKTGFQAGRDVEGMAGDLSRWMGAVSDIKKAEELNQKPPLFKKLFAAGSVEEEALQTLMAKKKTEDMRDQLKNIIMFSRGHGAWEELLRTEADIRKKRQKAIYDREEKIQKIKEWIGIGILVTAITGFIFFMFYLYLSTRGYISVLDVIEYFIEYFDMYYYLFVPWDFHNTAWVILGLIWYLNKLNTKYVRKNYNAIFTQED